jgi:hypothetical protein
MIPKSRLLLEKRITQMKSSFQSILAKGILAFSKLLIFITEGIQTT